MITIRGLKITGFVIAFLVALSMLVGLLRTPKADIWDPRFFWVGVIILSVALIIIAFKVWQWVRDDIKGRNR